MYTCDFTMWGGVTDTYTIPNGLSSPARSITKFDLKDYTETETANSFATIDHSSSILGDEEVIRRLCI